MTKQFDHEKLHVYQASIKFAERGPIVWLKKNLEQVPRHYAVYGQLDRASTSISLNIAEAMRNKYTTRSM